MLELPNFCHFRFFFYMYSKKPGWCVSWLHGTLKVTFQPERVELSTLQVIL